MRDPARIPMVLELVRRIWKMYPDLRLGQLILNAVPPGLGPSVEDDELVRNLALTYRDALHADEEDSPKA